MTLIPYPIPEYYRDQLMAAGKEVMRQRELSFSITVRQVERKNIRGLKAAAHERVERITADIFAKFGQEYV